MPNNVGEATVDEVHVSIANDLKVGIKPTQDAVFTKQAALQNQVVRKQRQKNN